MNGKEIREKIRSNNKAIEEAMSPSFFTLNKKVEALLAENEELRRVCPHEYDELGYCIYCDKKVN